MQEKVHDIHPHIISDDERKYPHAPIGGVQSDWSKEHHVTAEDMVAAMDQAGIESSALVQAATSYGYDNSYVADAVAKYPDRFTAVATIDVLAPDAVETLKKWLARGVTGIRLYTGGSKLEFDFSWLNDPRSYPIWEFAGKNGIAICVQTRPPAFPTVIELAKRFPGTKIVLDHLARMDITDGPPYANAKPLFDLAAYPNIYLKVTPRTFDLAGSGKASPETFFPKLVAAFGAKRIAFGSNYPASAGTLEEIVERAKKNLASLSAEDRHWILAGTSEVLYPKLNGAAAPARSGDSKPATKGYPKTGPATLHTLLGVDNASTKSIRSGAVKSDLVVLDFEDHELVHEAFKPMVREGRFDWGELAIVTFLQAKFYGKPLVLVPAVIGGRFQHHCVAYNAERGTLAPKDLEGKRIGVRSYTQTTGAWIRGILQNEYGVDPGTVRWVVFEDAHLAEFKDPPNVKRAPKGKKLIQMLFDGEVDAAMLGNDMPKDPRVKTVIPDPKAAAKEWYDRKHIVPMNHMVVVREELSKQRPDVVRELYRMLLESRDLDTKPADGIQMRPFGVENLRGALGAIIDYAFQQKIIGRKLTVDELFDDTTRTLGR